MSSSITLDHFKDGSPMARDIADKYSLWKSHRKQVEDRWVENKKYIYGTSTIETGDNNLPYRNKTVTPKICQLFEQLYSLTYNIKFANTSWVKYVSSDRTEAAKAKKDVMNAFLQKMLDDSGFYQTALQLDIDLYLYGNSFAKVVFERDFSNNLFSQEEIAVNYSGAKIERISPFDIVFNPLAKSFAETPKIIRRVVDMATFQKTIQNQPDLYDMEQVNKMMDARGRFFKYDDKDRAKANSFVVDGFGTLQDYYEDGSVELLEFYGDIYDIHTNEVHSNVTMVIADKNFVVMNHKNDANLGEGIIFHNTDRTVPDNLWAQSKLSNLMGLQFLVNKITNGIADAIDFIISPPQMIEGDVDDYVWRPGAKVYVNEGKITTFPVDSKFLGVDFKTDKIMNQMEMFAGLPSQAMGFKTKGEKTLGEVQMLESSALRQFSVNVKNQERKFWQPLVNCMFVQCKNNMVNTEVIKMVGEEGVEIFKTITSRDLDGNGIFKPVGTDRFDKILKLQSDLITISNSAIAQMPTVQAHFSGNKIAEMLGEITGLEEYDVIKMNANLEETAQLELAKVQLQQELQAYIQTTTNQPSQQELDLQQIQRDSMAAAEASVAQDAYSSNTPSQDDDIPLDGEQ